MKFRHSLKMVLYILRYVVAVIVIKLLVHRLNIEIIPLNAIFSALIGANVFLIGFLISGVLADYKESEKLPGEIACTILTIVDEINFISIKYPNIEFFKERLIKARNLIVDIRKWLLKEATTKKLFLLIEDLTSEYALLEKYTQPNYLARLKQEQNNLRKIITRIHTIRETDFISTGYFIAFTTTIMLIFGIVFLKIEPFYESLFFVGLVTYMLLFLLKLIKDLDNPFGYYEHSSFEDVSIKPIDDAIIRITEKIEDITSTG
jgi:hypothetical protein